ncbi:hypothetical protein KDD17_15695 [Sulfitobacter albidus]|uniref:RNase NYN domain-containing protein n=1 Tax=Sulfitobacter albidus TaxID=2829501 RepID=A0A975JDA0_9RHOB|nr:hypothetical protein [Sulfitobacter albidus]QUJ76318.1 hypothetical protein KDD17_15695 [Sulfitobacter albidus]
MELVDWLAIGVLGAALLAVFTALRRRTKIKKAKDRRRIAVDGTNVMFWHDNRAKLATLKKVVTDLRRRGYDPVVFLDASSRHHIGDRSFDEGKFASALDLARNRIMVCPARTEADEFILKFARQERLAIVSNDRFRDRPRAARNIRLIRGRVDGDRTILKGL